MDKITRKLDQMSVIRLAKHFHGVRPQSIAQPFFEVDIMVGLDHAVSHPNVQQKYHSGGHLLLLANRFGTSWLTVAISMLAA